MQWAQALSLQAGPNHFIELLRIFGINMPLWLSYDHWTGVKAAIDQVSRQQVSEKFPALLLGSQDFLQRLDEIKSAPSADILARAHQLLAAPHLFGVEIGLNLPAFVIAMIITAILVIGIKESASFNSAIVVLKVSVVLFVLVLGSQYIHPGNWGHNWSTFAPFGFSGIGTGAAYIFFAYIGFDAVSTTAQEAKNPQRDLPIAIIASLAACTLLYIGVAAVLTGMVPWRDVNIEAPIARAFLDRNLHWASDIITAGALAGLTSVMLVMLLGQTRVLYAMAKDGLLPGKFLCGHPSQVPHALQEHHPGGTSGRDCGQHHPHRRYRQDGEHRNSAGFCNRLRGHHGAATHESGPASPVSRSFHAAGPHSGDPLQRLHDVQARVDELGATDHLAGDWAGCVLHIQPQAQHRATAGGIQHCSWMSADQSSRNATIGSTCMARRAGI